MDLCFHLLYSQDASQLSFCLYTSSSPTALNSVDLTKETIAASHHRSRKAFEHSNFSGWSSLDQNFSWSHYCCIIPWWGSAGSGLYYKGAYFSFHSQHTRFPRAHMNIGQTLQRRASTSEFKVLIYWSCPSFSLI